MKRFVVAAAAAVVVALPAGLASAASQAGPLDTSWLKSSIQGDIFEVTGGKMAMQMGQSADVRALGRRLVHDHSKSLADARKLASSLGIKSPTSATPSEQWELQVVRSQGSATFDRWYTMLEVKDHMQDISDAQNEVRNGTTQAVKSEAAKEIPMLKTHLELSQAAEKSAVTKSALKH